MSKRERERERERDREREREAVSAGEMFKRQKHTHMEFPQ